MAKSYQSKKFKRGWHRICIKSRPCLSRSKKKSKDKRQDLTNWTRCWRSLKVKTMTKIT